MPKHDVLKALPGFAILFSLLAVGDASTPVKMSPAVTGLYGEVAVSHTIPTKIGGSLFGRRGITFWNCGAAELRCGSDNQVTVLTGWPVAAKNGDSCGSASAPWATSLGVYCLNNGMADQTAGSGVATYFQEVK